MFDGGRKLSVGDCALFQAGNAPPFIGILCKVTQDKDTTKLSVNWLYRPADVKLAKGVLPEAAPNEIFYSFHKDEISAASLLHPCKVAFLRKGAELPPGVASFVCRRVYDTANKCLWWLTDRDYTDEHQDEVDQLLERTKLEMQAVVQSGGPSPRSLTGPTSSQQLKSSSEVAQNVTFSVPSKGKKRERSDQNLEPSKRERTLKSVDGDSSPSKRERSMKPEEIASITDKDGGLQNPSCVERLVQLMQQDQNDGVRKAADVASRRTLLAGVVAATERDDCLSRFVQLGGLPMLDDWLQEAHKGKVGDGGSPKEGDKGVEELLLTLLRALDKLPVDLDGLKTCSIGKSVNNLRSHKNLEIQKKARKLVDTWKKRVIPGMKNSGDGKSSSNHAICHTYKQSSPDVVQSHLMKGGPTEVAVKSSGASVGSAKPMPNGTNFGEGMAKSSSFPGNKMTNPAGNSPSLVKKEEVSSKMSTGSASAEVHCLPVKDEKSNSSQSQSNGQAWTGITPGKNVSNSTWKDDTKNSSITVANSKPAAAASRHPSVPNNKGQPGSVTGASKDAMGGKPLIWSRGSADKNASMSSSAPEKGSADAARESANSQQRLIVRIPNPGRSPARVNSGSFEQSTPGNRVMSPNMPERNASVSMDSSDTKSRLQNSNQNGPSIETNPEGKSIGAGKGGSSAAEDRDKYVSSLPGDMSVEIEKRCDDSTRSEADRSSKDGQDGSGSSNFVQRGGCADGVSEPDGPKKGESEVAATGPSSAGAAAPEVTAMDVDDRGISLLASVAANEINRVVPSSLEKGQPEACNGNLEHSTRLPSDSGTSQSKETCEKQVTVKDGGGRKDLAESSTKSREDCGAEHKACVSGCPVADAASDKENAVDSTSGSAEPDAKDGEKRHFTAQEPGRTVDTTGGARNSLERHTEDNNLKTSRVPSEPVSYSSDMNTASVSGADKLGYIQDGVSGNSGKKDSLEEKKASAIGKSSMSGIELNMAYASGGDFTVDSSRDEEMENAVEGQTFGKRDSDGHRIAEMSTSFPEEEVLEVARQAAKEVEQMERWKESKPGAMPNERDGQDGNSSAFQSSEPRDGGFSDTGREHRWKPQVDKTKDEDTRKRSGVYLEGDHDSVMERMGEGSVRRGEGEDDQSRCGGFVDRKLMNPGQEAVESMLDRGQEHRRRAIDGRAAVRVPSFHSNQMPALPNLPMITSTSNSAHQVVKPSQRSLAGGEPTTPEQATETTGPNDGAVGGSDVSERPDFDLNEGFAVEDNRLDDSTTSPIAPVPVVAPISTSVVAQANGVAAPIAIVTKGPFVLPASPIRTKSELGWKGSAATSAFRPAEPRRTPDGQPEGTAPEPVQLTDPVKPVVAGKKIRPPLDIDLNVADERGLEEVVMSAASVSTISTTVSSQGSAAGLNLQGAGLPSASVSGLTYHSELSTCGPQQAQVAQQVGNSGSRPILDLNVMDESEESGMLLEMQPEAGSSTRGNNSSSSQAAACRVMRDFDLNDGPSVEETVPDDQPVIQSLRGLRGPPVPNAAPIITSIPGLRRGSEVVAPWFTVPALNVAIPTFANRDAPYSVAAAAAAQSYLGGGPGPTPFHSDVYRGTASLTTPSGVTFPSSTQGYQHGIFPLVPGLGFTSAGGFPANHAAPYMESVGSSGFPVPSSSVVASSFARPPFLMPGIADMGPADSSGGGDGWGSRPSLDLNAGPEAADSDVNRDDGLNMKQTSMLSGQVSMEQLRGFRIAPTGGTIGAPLPKRKEPDGGWDVYRNSGFKQQTWR
ncbi:hypothetical protein R1flu_016325 [Riccia fluitans]|uniref:Uncharacterized protein n=1 Tax=Riccia fluitans TaxID=41844 RepID=A0ABD1YLJ8_9MARC